MVSAIENDAPPSAYAAAPMLQEIDDLWSLTDVVKHSKASYWTMAREPVVCDDEDPYASLYANDNLDSGMPSDVPEVKSSAPAHSSTYNSSHPSSFRKKGPEPLSPGYTQSR